MDGLIEHRHAALWIIVVAMAIRIAWVLVFPVEPVSDSGAYQILARNIVDYGNYGFTPHDPSAYWAVGTSAIVAVTYLIFGESDLGVVLSNLLASLIALVLIYQLGLRYFGRTAALFALGLTAFWPNLILFNSILSSELYFIALCAAGLLFWERRKEGWLNLLACGLIWGAACYVRPVIILLPFALVLSAWGSWRELIRAAGSAVIVVVLIVLTVSPWTYRNYQAFGEPVMVSTNFGPNFWMGNNPETTGRYQKLPTWTHGMGEIERSDRLEEVAVSYIKDEPIQFVVRTLYKVGLLHAYETIGVAWNENAIGQMLGETGKMGVKLLSTGYWYGLLVLSFIAIGALILSRRLSGLFHPCVLGWGYFTAVHAVIVVEDRYHMSAVPFIALLAGHASSLLVGQVMATRSKVKV